MIIQCERCNRKFKIDDALIKPPGSRVKCSKCGNTFFVEKKENSKFKTPPEMGQSYEKEFETKNNSLGKGEEEINTYESRDCPSQFEESKEKPEEKAEKRSELSHQSRESETNISKAPTDGINWEEFVNITRSKVEEEKFNLSTEKDHGVVRKDDPSEFNWAKLSINNESEESFTETPKLFDATQEEEYISPRESETVEENTSNPEFSALSEFVVDVDKEKLSTNQVQSKAGPPPHRPPHSSYVSMNEILPRKEGLASRTIKKLIYVTFTVLIFVVVIGAGMVILANQGLIPHEKVSKVSESILSGLPVKFFKDPMKDLIVSDLSGKWMTTRNGLIYVVSGNITNQSKKVINYVQIRSEFMGGGKSLYEKVVYAGNTFSEDELKILPLEDILQKLDRKNGDIDFNNPKKLAGLNYGIEPGESVPFFTVFPSENQILGLKYKINVAGFEKSVSR